MKRVVISFALMVIIAVCAAAECLSVRSITKDCIALMDKAVTACRNEDMISAVIYSSDFADSWEDSRKYLTFLVDDEKLADIDSSAAGLNGLSDSGELLIRAQTIKRQLEILGEDELPLWYNII